MNHKKYSLQNKIYIKIIYINFSVNFFVYISFKSISDSCDINRISEL